MCKHKIELLSPAGDMEKLEYAILFGADAVYLALKEFGMRAGTGNFEKDELITAVKKAHLNGVKVYVTCNILPKNNHMDNIKEYLEVIKTANVDALIVADIGVLAAVKKYLPNIAIHVSTQAGIVNYAAAQEFFNMGAKRVVLARELQLSDIQVIREKTDPSLEIEAFVHGAMCVSFSGRCLLSSYLTGRDANRGECAQPCRWNYYLMEEKRPGQYFKICEDDAGTYILNAKDLCMIEYIDKLAAAGINSFKIEGRAKSFYYVAMVTNAYKKAIELYYKNPDGYKVPSYLIQEVEKVSHRQYSTGFYFGNPNNGQFYENGGYIRTCEVMATVEKSDEKFIYCIQRNKFNVGENLEIISPSKKAREILIESIWDENDVSITSVPHPMMKFKIPNTFGTKYEKGAIIRKNINA